jgi:hypothetical protein
MAGYLVFGVSGDEAYETDCGDDTRGDDVTREWEAVKR